MILVDMNQVMISNLMAQIGSHHNIELDENLVRHMVLNSLRGYRNRFVKDYGELVICCDDKNYWRKKIFPYYKANRKKNRNQSELDWNSIFRCLNNVRDEIKEYFPYKVIQIETCEADDIIATVVHDIEGSQLLNGSEMIMILSGDKDFIQLHQYENVVQYDPVRKRWIKHNNPEEYLKEHIAKGDRGDGVPNILSKDDCFINGRQRPLRSKLLNKIVEMKIDDVIKDEELQKYKTNWNRNRRLVDLSLIPDDVKDRIIQEYWNRSDPPKNRHKLFNYFVEKKLKNLIENIGDF